MEWQERAEIAEAQLAAQQEKTNKLVEAVKTQKGTWEGRLSELEGDIMKLKAQNNLLEVRLREKDAELTKKTTQLQNLIALTSDKPKPGEEDPQERIQELEGQIAAFAQGALLQKKDFEDKIVEATKAAQLDVVKARVLEQKVADLEEQLKVANERAYDAESRLGRLQKSHQQLVVEKNKANFAAAAPKAHSVDISADVAEMDAIGDELANLNFNDIDIDMDIDIDAELEASTPRASPAPTPVKANSDVPKIKTDSIAKADSSKKADSPKKPETTSKADKSLPVSPRTNVKTSAVTTVKAKPKVDWNELDDMLNNM